MKYSIFIWIPKNAGSSIANDVLVKQLGFEKRKYPGEYDTFGHNNNVTFTHVSIKHLLAAGYLNQDFYDNSFKFCFCRDPYDRLVSAWKYHRDVEKKITYSFEDYVNHISERIDTSEGLPHIGLHNQPGLIHANRQTDWISEGVDFIGRFENLQNDFNKICDIIGAPSIQLRKTNPTQHKLYHNYYTRELYDIVNDVYDADFTRFKYDKK